ncbi:uncharacterized protein JN550_010667 [Neoarthrinium moseri]|uniref:uncharacterized protein n=1 Tax=Neoarthrinium moseri TaxID=1658444 RepID=UPI001FDB6DA3|nr:uncharacterized protein JN550_010667 [Neoarthrinium moseri]KAI1861727.1 hypothetical protein JN550_010667 [Neoarthrinium moseri]
MPSEYKPKYVEVDADFKPLPKYGHLSQKTPQFAEAEPAIKAAYAPFSDLMPDWPTIRAGAGDPDAPMPPGGPDPYRDVATELLQFAARDGHMIELKVYKSLNVKQDATLVYRMHGGGWVVGRHEVDGAENVYAATHKNIVVVSVDYRLAPEYPFPYAINDSYDGLLWCKKNANTLGFNPEKIIITGSSAGGNLAAALVLEAWENRVTGIVAQVLHFPITCHPKFSPKDKYEFGSYVQNRDNAVIGIKEMETVFDAYAPNATPDYRHSPLLANSLAGLPPALIQCGGCDVLRDDAFAYAEALRAANVEVEIHGYQGVPHCFPAVLATLPETPEFYKRYNAFLDKYAGQVA